MPCHSAPPLGDHSTPVLLLLRLDEFVYRRRCALVGDGSTQVRSSSPRRGSAATVVTPQAAVELRTQDSHAGFTLGDYHLGAPERRAFHFFQEKSTTPHEDMCRSGIGQGVESLQNKSESIK